MECKDIRRLFRKHLKDQLSPRQKADFEEHINDCADCFLLDREIKMEFPAGQGKQKPTNSVNE